MSDRERFVRHITITSGDTRDSPRSEVADDVVRLLVPLLDRALTGEHVGVPGRSGWTFSGGVYGRCCMVTVCATDPTAEGPAPSRVPVVSVGISADSRCARRLWQTMHVSAPYMPRPVTRADVVPPSPWCAARIEIGAALTTGDMTWIGDFERRLAWAWLALRSPD